jgi:hypothetical protein
MVILKQKNTKNKSNKKRMKQIANFLSKKNLWVNIAVGQFVILLLLVVFNVLVIRENTKYNVENNNLLVKFENRWYVDYKESLQDPYETDTNKIIQIALNTAKTEKVKSTVLNPLPVIFESISKTMKINSTVTEICKNGKVVQIIPNKLGIMGRAFVAVRAFLTPKDTPIDITILVIGMANNTAQREEERRRAYAYYAQVSQQPVEIEVNTPIDRQKSL